MNVIQTENCVMKMILAGLILLQHNTAKAPGMGIALALRGLPSVSATYFHIWYYLDIYEQPQMVNF